MQNNNVPEIHNNIIGCEEIIEEFINTVDEEKGGDFAIRIKALYQYFYNTLVMANIKKMNLKLMKY